MDKRKINRILSLLTIVMVLTLLPQTVFSVNAETNESSHTHNYQSTVTAPTCTEQGYTTYTCTFCGESHVSDYTDPRPLNILMIGNSFSWDAADFWYDMQTSMTYDAMKSMLAANYDVHLAVMYKGSATLAYHATCAMNNTAAYTYTEIGPETSYQWTPSSGTNATNNILDQLEARDWDIIVIQSYQHEADGTEPRSTYTGGDARFAEPEASVGYLLDYFAEHEPNADVYYYMPWATTKFYGSDTEAGYHAMAKYTETTVPHLTGTNSGKAFAGIIPVGTGIQNARTTYFDTLRFSSGTGSTALLKDPQNGLQYDSQHLSFGLGRYIAGIIVAETLIPKEMRKDSYVLPTVKESPAVGELPQEYGVISQLAAKHALKDPFKLTTLSGYDTDLADRVCDAIKTADYSANGIADEAELKTYVESVVGDKLENMGAAECSVTIHNFALKNGQIADMEATVTLRVGYTSRSVEITVTNGKAHPFGEWEVISVPSAAGPGLNRRICQICGFTDEREIEGSWQKFALAEHLQELPDDFCGETNLWDLLEPEKLMIDHLGNWVSAGATVYSVTIPVKPGDKIYANSFDQTDARKGIQVSFIGNYGIVKTTFSSQTYNEFHANGGYLIAPEGAIAVNIPVWNVNADNNTISFLDYDHTYTPTITAPTCTERGYTTYTCECGDSYVGDYVEATGHSYKNGICTACDARIPDVEWELGTIASATGENNATNSRLRTVGYQKLTDFAGMGIGKGYTMTNFVYDENYAYMGTSSWLGDGIPFTTAELQQKYPTGVYFRVAFRALDQRRLTEADVAASGVKFYQVGEEVPKPNLGFTFENIGSIGVWQDGSIWDGKLFALGAAGTGAVFDVKTGAKLGSLTLDRKDALKPHANSVCFGSTYYAQGDKYPLLYVNIYNNYASAVDRMEGTCCVYRITESEKGFATELVQVIKIGFTEDLTLWKSKENNGDVRPYGNFVVDTAANKLYAYVMRDASKTTRFFSFDIPTLSEGVYNASYGCNVVTLETGDIKTQFDSEHYYYLQGCCYSSGMILYVGDFGGDAPLCLVNLESQKVSNVFCLGYAGLKAEPEVLCVDPADGTLYYAAADGVLRAITLQDIHLHGYNAAITAPTCTEQGYTTYTCACGDSYVTDQVDAAGHTYENGTCTICGAEDPDYVLPGDLDGDGEVSDWDAILLNRYLAGWKVEIDLRAADTDGDGEISDWDAILLERFLAGWKIEL